LLKTHKGGPGGGDWNKGKREDLTVPNQGKKPSPIKGVEKKKKNLLTRENSGGSYQGAVLTVRVEGGRVRKRGIPGQRSAKTFKSSGEIDLSKGLMWRPKERALSHLRILGTPEDSGGRNEGIFGKESGEKERPTK